MYSTSWPPQEKVFIWPPFFEYNKRLLRQSSTTRAARAAQGCTDDRVRMGAGQVCANDEVAKCGRTGITRADTEDMLSRERTHGLHNALLTRR